MRAIVVYIVLAFIFVSFPNDIWGQCVKKETTSKVTDAVILHSEGMFSSAIWELGRTLYDKKTGATIRHTVNQGNGNNLNVNSKLPFRILIAPTDVIGTLTWSEAMGFDAQNNNNQDAVPTGNSKQGGCSTYVPPPGENFPGYAGVKQWRLPTQRELQLMWLLHDAIDQAFLPKYSKRDKLSGTYWTSTEQNAGTAWYVNFDGPIYSGKSPKTTQYKVRCVKDY